MKKILLFILLFASDFGFSQKTQFCLYTPIDVPIRSIMPNMRVNLGFGASFAYRPIFGFPMLAEIKTSFGRYATQTTTESVQLYQNYKATNVHSSYASKFNKYLIGTKWLIGYDIHTIRGFITPQIGLANFRTISSYNFNDPNSKNYSGKHVDLRNLGGVYGGEIGFEILLNNVFKKKMSSNVKHRLLVSGSILRGFTTFQYTNTNYMQDLNTASHLNGDANSLYIYLQNKYSYANNVTEVYSSKLFMWGINIGYVINFEQKDE